MIEGRSVLAVVPARSGSKGIPNKNLQRLQGLSLIGWAGRVLSAADWVDRRVISTDSPEYAREGERHGLDAPFLRPAELADDSAGAIETIQHALASVEAAEGTRFDVVLIVEPTSPLRSPEDLHATVDSLIERNADAAITVSPLDSKSHPRKVLALEGDLLGFYRRDGRKVTNRQSLEQLYFRNGVCYALTRACVTEIGAIFGPRTVGVVIGHPVANIDEPLDLAWAEFLLERGLFATGTPAPNFPARDPEPGSSGPAP